MGQKGGLGGGVRAPAAGYKLVAERESGRAKRRLRGMEERVGRTGLEDGDSGR